MAYKWISTIDILQGKGPCTDFTVDFMMDCSTDFIMGFTVDSIMDFTVDFIMDSNADFIAHFTVDFIMDFTAICWIPYLPFKTYLVGLLTALYQRPQESESTLNQLFFKDFT